MALRTSSRAGIWKAFVLILLLRTLIALPSGGTKHAMGRVVVPAEYRPRESTSKREYIQEDQNKRPKRPGHVKCIREEDQHFHNGALSQHHNANLPVRVLARCVLPGVIYRRPTSAHASSTAVLDLSTAHRRVVFLPSPWTLWYYQSLMQSKGIPGIPRRSTSNP